MPRRGKKKHQKKSTPDKPQIYHAVRYMHSDNPNTHSVNDDAEIGVSMFSSIELPIIRKTFPTLLAHKLVGTPITRYEDLSPEKQKQWDKEEIERQIRNDNTIEIDIKLAAYGSHERKGELLDQDNNERYLYWEWLRKRVDINDVPYYFIPKDKYEYSHHTIPNNNTKFNEFITQYQEGDEIWLYENNGFSCLAGRAGWLILRDEKVLDVFQTCLS